MTEQMEPLQASPPNYLKSYARTMWKQLHPYLSRLELKDIDKTLVESFCLNYQILRESYDSIRDDGVQKSVYKVVMTPTGDIIDEHAFVKFSQNPAVKTLDAATSRLNTIGQQLGLSPMARAELTKLGIGTGNSESVEETMKEAGLDADDSF